MCGVPVAHRWMLQAQAGLQSLWKQDHYWYWDGQGPADALDQRQRWGAVEAHPDSALEDECFNWVGQMGAIWGLGCEELHPNCVNMMR
jgi:hypothetical protein